MRVKFLIVYVCFVNFLFSQEQIIPLLKNESWYGAAVNEGDKTPFYDGYGADLPSTHFERISYTKRMSRNRYSYFVITSPSCSIT